MEYFLEENKKEEDPVGYMKKLIDQNKNPNKKCFHLFKLVDRDEVKLLMDILVQKEKSLHIDVLKKWTEFLEDEIDE